MSGVQSDSLPAIELANFELLSPIGVGGMGAVYLAEQKRPRRKVAVKVVVPDETIPPVFIEALKNEGDIAARFDHDHLVHVYECGIVDDHYFLAMQYLGGGDLDTKLEQGVTLNEVTAIIRSMASALGHIHAKGYVHRDVKPANILFNDEGKPVLADFGIAKDAETVGLLTSAGYSTGTPAYMSPEQIKGGTVDGRSDLYSLGIVLYQCLTGRLPFWSENDYELKDMQVRESPPPVVGSLARFQPILDRLLAKDPDRRFESAEQLIQALDGLGPVSGMATQRMPSGGERPVATPASGPSPVTVWVREMSQRRVFRVLALYVALGWGLTEIINEVVDRIDVIPEAMATYATTVFLAGLPVALVLAWVYDWGPRGLQRVPSSRKGMLVASVGVSLAVAWLLWPSPPPPSPVPAPEPPAIATDPVLAVLPIEALGDDPDVQTLAQGMVLDLTDALTGFSGLKVKAQLSTRTLVDRGMAPQELAGQLGATHLVTATLEHAASSGAIRIRARLLDASANQVWADRFEDDLSNVLALQQRIATEISRALGREASAPAQRQSQTVDPEAYRLVAEANLAMTMNKIDESIHLLNQAVDLDPDYPKAYIDLGLHYASRAWFSGERESPDLDLAEVNLRLAERLAPEAPEVAAGWSLLHMWRGDWANARAAADRYLASNYRYVQATGVASVLHALGHFEEAVGLLREASAVDPFNPLIPGLACLFAGSLGDDEYALASCDRALDMGLKGPDNAVVWSKVVVLRRMGLGPSEIRSQVGHLLEPGEGLFDARMVDAMLDPQRRASYLQALRESEMRPLDYAASVYQLGTLEEAEAMAWQELEANRFNPVNYFMLGSEHLRGHESFVPLMEAAGLADYWRSGHLPDFCDLEGEQLVCN